MESPSELASCAGVLRVCARSDSGVDPICTICSLEPVPVWVMPADGVPVCDRCQRALSWGRAELRAVPS